VFSRKNGAISGCRWGVRRKRALLEREQIGFARQEVKTASIWFKDNKRSVAA
jgi:hypothetical protein